LGSLELLNLGGNRLTSLSFPAGLTNLNTLMLIANQLTELTLPPDMTRLLALNLIGNPLTQLVLSEGEAITLAATVADLNQGIPVFKYPLDMNLTKLVQAAGAFRFGITGPPGFYTVLSSTNIASWSVVDVVNNPLGSVFFLDTTAHLSPQRFYIAQLLPSPPQAL
jgi:Leucine-rich repeat (LRR) protein